MRWRLARVRAVRTPPPTGGIAMVTAGGLGAEGREEAWIGGEHDAPGAARVPASEPPNRLANAGGSRPTVAPDRHPCQSAATPPEKSQHHASNAAFRRRACDFRRSVARFEWCVPPNCLRFREQRASRGPLRLRLAVHLLVISGATRFALLSGLFAPGVVELTRVHAQWARRIARLAVTESPIDARCRTAPTGTPPAEECRAREGPGRDEQTLRVAASTRAIAASPGSFRSGSEETTCMLTAMSCGERRMARC